MIVGNKYEAQYKRSALANNHKR